MRGLSVQRLVSIQVQYFINERPVLLFFFFVAIDIIYGGLYDLGSFYCVLVGCLKVQVL